MRYLYLFIIVCFFSCKEKAKNIVKETDFTPVFLELKQITGIQIPVDVMLYPARLQLHYFICW